MTLTESPLPFLARVSGFSSPAYRFWLVITYQWRVLTYHPIRICNVQVTTCVVILPYTFNCNFIASQTEPAAAFHFAWHSLSRLPVDAPSVRVSGVREGMTGYRWPLPWAWIPVCNYTPALAPSWFSSEFRSFNNALKLDSVASLPCSHGSYTRYICLRILGSWDISDIPAKPIPRRVAMSVACGWRYPWCSLLMNWWKHAWHGKYYRSMKNYSHRNKSIMMVGFRSASQTQTS